MTPAQDPKRAAGPDRGGGGVGWVLTTRECRGSDTLQNGQLRIVVLLLFFFFGKT